MSEGFSTTSTSGSTYPTAAMESHPADFDVNTGGHGAENSTTGAAKEQAGEVAETAKQAGAQVAGTVKEQAGAVTAEVGNQARNLLNQTRTEISDQASTQQQRVAGGLHSIADELQGLINGEPKQGVASDIARMASDKAHEIADWLDRRDPASLVEEVRSYARRRPGAYLAIALGAGILAGRLTKGLAASNDSGQKAAGPAQGAVSGGHASAVGTGYATPGYQSAGYQTAGYDTGAAQAGYGTSGYGQDDALLTAADLPAVQAIPPVEGYGVAGGTQGDFHR